MPPKKPEAKNRLPEGFSHMRQLIGVMSPSTLKEEMLALFEGIEHRAKLQTRALRLANEIIGDLELHTKLLMFNLDATKQERNYYWQRLRKFFK